MLRGLSACSIDDKGRLTVPSNYRKILMEEADGQLVVTIDTEDRCLLLYPLAKWLTIEEQLGQLPSLNPAARRIQRLLIGHATDLELDRQGRILIPGLLREYAGLLDRTIMLVGLGTKMAIYSEALWQLRRDAWLSEGLEDEEAVPSELESLPL